MACRSSASDYHIKGYGHRPQTLDTARKMGAIDEGYDQLAPAVQDAELVILCTPVGLFRPLLAELAPLLAPGTIVTDVGSTKRSIVSAAEEYLAPTVHFVGSHPMAGSEKRGVQHARPDLYEGALCIVTPPEKTDRSATETVESFWRRLGMRTCRVTPDEHDRRLADISHLPHALAAALVTLQEDASTPLGGKGFLDVTRIAAGDGALWRDIFIDNRDNLRASLARLREELGKLDELLDPNRAAELERWLDQAAQRREGMGEQKKQE